MNAYSPVIAAPTLPSPDAWHRSDKVRAIVAALHKLDGIHADLTEAGLGNADLSNLGALEARHVWGKPTMWSGDGFVGELLSVLEAERTDALARAFLDACRDNGWRRDCEAADEHSDLLDDHFDSMAAAIVAVPCDALIGNGS